MAQTKTEFKWFTVPQYEAEQEYLRGMHRSGWRLKNISFPGFYHFEECTPEDVVYQLDYNQNGTAHKSEYVQMFADCGWEYMFDFVGYSYFRKPVSQMEGSEEIFCDDESRLEMMKRVFAGRVTPMICAFFLILLPQFFLQTAQFNSSAAHQVLSVLFLILFVMYLAIFISFGIQFFSYEKKIREPDMSSRMKYVSLLLITLVICFLVVFSIVNNWRPRDSKYSMNTSPGQYSVGAEYLNETIWHEMELKEGDELEVAVQLLKGEIQLRIFLDDKDSIYECTTSKLTGVTLPIHQSGTYTIVTTGEAAEGSFNFQVK